MSRLIAVPALAAVPAGSRPAPLPVTLHRAVAKARRRHRPLIAAAGQWAFARGVPLPADHIALWATTAEDAGYPGRVDGITGPWRASRIPEFLETVAAWCTLTGCSPPADLSVSLWHLYGFLAGTQRLHPASDALTELRAALVVFGRSDRCIPRPSPPGPMAA